MDVLTQAPYSVMNIHPRPADRHSHRALTERACLHDFTEHEWSVVGKLASG